MVRLIVVSMMGIIALVVFIVVFLCLLSEHHREDKWYKRHDGYLG